ncbi:hypothetical protein Poli38472_004961 [Pythium oligandrum]|uniref:N-acetyltransferase domain-containing protein n=1 Tax=Pythium oligandrum TaxID=41045 RepID=A0A8K1CCN1_PYTOL|nr:hypothetical protein Poli38472_004961 [Pythium oligandrum]|eukprot:TMW59892.1 hypothetical protein Poli38472_004961 [Pythium oligandrum]
MAIAKKPDTTIAVSEPIDFTQLSVRRATRKEVTRVGEILQDGFHDSSFFACVDLHTTHIKAERYIFKRWSRIVNDYSYVVLYKGQVVGHFAITPANDRGLSFWKLMQYGLYQLPFRHGWTIMTRLFDLLEAESGMRQEIVEQLPPAEILDAFTITSEWRGRGIGTHILRDFILKDRPRMVLFAHKQSDADFYERMGFRTVTQRMVPTSYGREWQNTAMEYVAPAKTA